MFITLGIVRAATAERSGSVPAAAGEVNGCAPPWRRFRARFFGAVETAGQDHAADEAARHEQERDEDASHH